MIRFCWFNITWGLCSPTINSKGIWPFCLYSHYIISLYHSSWYTVCAVFPHPPKKTFLDKQGTPLDCMQRWIKATPKIKQKIKSSWRNELAVSVNYKLKNLYSENPNSLKKQISKHGFSISAYNRTRFLEVQQGNGLWKDRTHKTDHKLYICFSKSSSDMVNKCYFKDY